MYQSLEAHLHDAFWAAEGEPAELPLIRDFLQRHPGRTLEIGCGSGRLLFPLLEQGAAIEGLEISADMLALFQQEAKRRGVNPAIHHCGLEDFHNQHPYASLLIPAFTLQLFSRQQLPNILTKLRSLTQPSGGLYLTTFIPWPEITGELEEDTWYPDKEITLPDGSIARCHTRHEIHRLEQSLTRQHRYSLTTATGSETLHSTEQVLQWYHLPELTLLLHQSAWQIDHIITDFTPSELCPDAHIITIYATAR